MDDRYRGMTVNERLYVSGLLEEFDLAVREKDIEKINIILNKVEITEESAITDIIKQLGLMEKK